MAPWGEALGYGMSRECVCLLRVMDGALLFFPMAWRRRAVTSIVFGRGDGEARRR